MELVSTGDAFFIPVTRSDVVPGTLDMRLSLERWALYFIWACLSGEVFLNPLVLVGVVERHGRFEGRLASVRKS
jgi:hypothetical protein